MEKHFTAAQSPGVPEQFTLHLEYDELLADYRELAGVPFSDAAFGEMLTIAARLQEISTRLEQMPSITAQFASLDEI